MGLGQNFDSQLPFPKCVPPRASWGCLIWSLDSPVRHSHSCKWGDRSPSGGPGGPDLVQNSII